MKNRLTVILLGTFLSTPSLGEESCLKLYYKLRDARQRLEELVNLQIELEEKFQTYVQKDFEAQSQGVFEEVHRNEALKMAFAQKKLVRNIDIQQRTVASTNVSYCNDCLTKQSTTPEEIKDLCQRCPSSTKCASNAAKK